MKTCTKCGQEKDLSEFHKEAKGKLGVRSECKECCKNRHSQYDTAEKYKKWVDRNRTTGNVTYWNMRARKVNDRCLKRYRVGEKLSGRELYDKFSNIQNCCYCGAEITHDSCHIEHVDPISKGGSNTIGNISFSCGRCNITKNDKTDKDFFDYIKTIYDHLKTKYE